MQRFTNLTRLRAAPGIRLPSLRLRRYANMNAPSAAETDSQAAAVANTSGITPESLSRTLKEKIEAQHVDIEDMSGNQITCSSPRKGLLTLCLQLVVAKHSTPS